LHLIIICFSLFINVCFTPSRDFAILYVAKPLLHATTPSSAVAAQRIATPLLRLAGLRRCYASPCRAKRGRCYVRRRLAEPLLRRAAPDRCYAPQYGSVAERSNALPDRYSLSGLRYSGRHDANPLLRTAAQRLTVATQFKTAPLLRQASPRLTVATLLNTAPLPSKSTQRVAVAGQREATPRPSVATLRSAWQSRCHAAPRVAVAMPGTTAPRRCYSWHDSASRCRCSSPQIVSKRHTAYALLCPSKPRLAIAIRRPARRSSWLRLSNAFQVGSSHDRASPSPITVHSNRPMPLFRH
jgi:hypothetical protein